MGAINAVVADALHCHVHSHIENNNGRSENPWISSYNTVTVNNFTAMLGNIKYFEINSGISLPEFG